MLQDQFIKPFLYEQGELPDITEDIDPDPNTHVTYIGFAKTGTANLASASFKIKKVTTTTVGGVITNTIEWAGGTLQYDKKWSERSLYAYSFKK